MNGNGLLDPSIQKCEWVCPGGEVKSSNGTLTIDHYVNQCVYALNCASNCYTCALHDPSFCLSCSSEVPAVNGFCPNKW